MSTKNWIADTKWIYPIIKVNKEIERTCCMYIASIIVYVEYHGGIRL